MHQLLATFTPWLPGAATSLVLTVLVGGAVAAAASVVYLLAVVTAARAALRRRRSVARRRRPRPLAPLPRLFVVVPAHNEEAVIAESLRSLLEQRYPTPRREIVVIADNCVDRTADIAREMGAQVLERQDRSRRGKGYALSWAFERLLTWDAGTSRAADAFIVVDADTCAHPLFLQGMAAALFPAAHRRRRDAPALTPLSGLRLAAVQGRYSVRNPGDSWRAALAAGAFDLFNHVKPLGRDFLGASVGLKGNGMGFTRAVIESVPPTGSSITEDIEYGLDLLTRRGVRVRYAPDARVWSAMPTTAAQSASQRERWERGRYRLVRQRALPLLCAGLLQGDLRMIEAALDLLTPPLAELAGLHLLVGLGVITAAAAGIALPGGPRVWLGAVALSLVGLAAYILGGLRLAHAPAAAYSALWRAPFYALWKFSLYAASFCGRGTVSAYGRKGGAVEGKVPAEMEWVRTERSPAPADQRGAST